MENWLDWINSLKKIDDIKQDLVPPNNPPEDEPRPKVSLTNEQRERLANAIVDSAIDLHRKRTGPFEVDMVCRQFMVDVIAHSYELGIEMPWSMYVRIVLNYLLEGMKNKSDALLVAFLIGIAYSNLMDEDDTPPEEE